MCRPEFLHHVDLSVLKDQQKTLSLKEKKIGKRSKEQINTRAFFLLMAAEMQVISGTESPEDTHFKNRPTLWERFCNSPSQDLSET